MIDYIVIEQPLASSEELYTRNLKKVGYYYERDKSCYKLYNVDKKFPLAVTRDQYSLKIEGSLPYFYQGHNLTFTRDDLRKCIELIEQLLKLKLSDAVIKKFEYGKIVELTATTARVVINNHENMGKVKKAIYPHYCRYITSDMELKIYDPIKNNTNARGKKANSLTCRNLIDSVFHGNDRLCKVEFRCKKPQILNDLKDVHVRDLYNQVFLERCKEKLIQLYSRITIHKRLESPSSKKELDSISILLRLIYENVPDPENVIHDYIHGFSDKLLNQFDKASRKTIMKKKMKRICKNGVDTYSLRDLFEQ